jgi:hypothetical protein
LNFAIFITPPVIKTQGRHAPLKLMGGAQLFSMHIENQPHATKVRVI